MNTSKIIYGLAISFLIACGNESTMPKTTETVVETKEQKSKYKYEMQWQGFKTPAKKAVKGTLTDIKLENTLDTANGFTSILVGSNFIINALSVSSGDATRDHNLTDHFFSKLMGDITGKFGAFKKGAVPVTLTMAGITKKIIFKYEDFGDSLRINGTIDILKDFKAKSAFDDIAESCKAFHDNKTWSEVNISAKIAK